MPWLTTYGATNKIMDEERDDVGRYQIVSGGPTSFTIVTMAQTIAILQYRYVGMTLAAAETCKTAINNPPTLTAVVRRESVGGSYCVEVTERTEGDWAEEV